MPESEMAGRRNSGCPKSDVNVLVEALVLERRMLAEARHNEARLTDRLDLIKSLYMFRPTTMAQFLSREQRLDDLLSDTKRAI